MASLRNDLSCRGLELVETHISWVFLSEREVWKIKKPVSLGFLDFSTADKRRDACEAEVRLNRRLSPEVYLGVVPVVLGEDGRHRLGGSGEPVDWAVHMVRLPEERRADRLLELGVLAAADVECLAEEIAAFHASARCDKHTGSFGRVEIIAGNIEENFEQTSDILPEHLSEEEAQELAAWQKSFLRKHEPLFAARIEGGHIKDGHGDLRLEHCYANDRESFTIVDCIEFNERFRFADVCADIAFLAMDLEWHGRVDLAEHLLAKYARAAQDYDLYPLVDFYSSYRAFVRGKVSTMMADDPSASFETRERAANEARRYFLLALAAERRSLQQPMVIAVGGVIASGKSTVAERLGLELGAPVIGADRTRKWMLGVPAETPVRDPAWQGSYSPEFTERVYSELNRRGEAVLGSGRSVILDASFRSRESRRAAKGLAEAGAVRFLFIECMADAQVCKERLRRRALESGVTDGRLEIFDAFQKSWESVVGMSAQEHRALDTTRPIEENLAQLRDSLPFWPSGLTA